MNYDDMQALCHAADQLRKCEREEGDYTAVTVPLKQWQEQNAERLDNRRLVMELKDKNAELRQRVAELETQGHVPAPLKPHIAKNLSSTTYVYRADKVEYTKERYDPTYGDGPEYTKDPMTAHDKGDWVRYEDCEAECDKLQDENGELRMKLGRMMNALADELQHKVRKGLFSND